MKPGFEFEAEVRRVARALWAADPGQGASEIIENKERDCIFEQEDLVHYLEVTTERTLSKVRDDSDKMVSYREKEARKGRFVKLWIVTKYEPTADQKTHCKPLRIDILSLKEFRRRVFDGVTYLELRQHCAFGSATDPRTDSQDISSVRYQPTAIRIKGEKRTVSIEDISDALLNKRIVVLLGDYGMGKSITIREIYNKLRKCYLKENDGPVPVAINLREYWGRDRPSEVLDRHARTVGLDNGLKLVRGFNAGRLSVLLDGFDETSAIPWSVRSIEKLRDVRRGAVAVIRNFVQECRGKTGLLIAGREHFFDSFEELSSSMGLQATDLVVSLDEFSDEEASAFLGNSELNARLPDWLPRRPLLLASFAAKGLLEAAMAQKEESDPAKAWDRLIDDICSREARIHSFLDKRAIRNILQILASRARQCTDGLGPVTETDLAEAFRAQTTAHPDNTAWPLLLRLPGLTARDAQPGTRYFLDDQMLMVFRAGSVVDFIINPRQDPRARDWKHGIGELGARVAIVQLAELNLKSLAAITVAAKSSIRFSAPTLALDLVQVGRLMVEDGEPVDFQGLEILDGYAEHLDLTMGGLPHNLLVRESTFLRLSCIGEPLTSFSMRDCVIEHLYGVSRKETLPAYVEASCLIGEFDSFATNAKLLQTENIAVPVRVLLTILRKLYVQGGGGRKESALFRGMSNESSIFVRDLLSVASREGIATLTTVGGQRVWHAVRNQRSRVLRLLESPSSSQDPAVLEARNLT